jgi:CRISPR-associated protein Cas2
VRLLKLQEKITYMRLMICYDIPDPKRLRKVERVISGFAVRLQDSLFEGEFTEDELRSLQSKLIETIEIDVDSVRYYPVCGHDLRNRLMIVAADEISCGAAWVV